jgi:glutathione S-transferase
VRSEITEQELGAARATIDELLDHLERTLMPGPWVVGNQFTLAEISIAPYMFRLAALGADQFWSRQRRPRINAWCEALAGRPAFKTAVSWPDESGGGYEEVGLGVGANSA